MAKLFVHGILTNFYCQMPSQLGIYFSKIFLLGQDKKKKQKKIPAIPKSFAESFSWEGGIFGK